MMRYGIIFDSFLLPILIAIITITAYASRQFAILVKNHIGAGGLTLVRTNTSWCTVAVPYSCTTLDLRYRPNGKENAR